MEPPHGMFGGSEECHSSESGWTMYIGSPIDEDAHCDNEENDDNLDYDCEDTQADPEVESDDSMASDASSGPSHYGIINPPGSGYDGLTRFQHQEEEYGKEKYFSDHKRVARKTKENQVVGKKVEKNELVFINSKGKAPAVQNGGKVKVRKNYWVGNKKK